MPPPNQSQNSCVRLCLAFAFDMSYFEKQFFGCDGVCMTVSQKCQSLLQLRCLSGAEHDKEKMLHLYEFAYLLLTAFSPLLSLVFLSYVPTCAVCSAFGVVTQLMRNLSPLQLGSRT